MANQKTKIFFTHSAGPQYGHGKGSYDLVKYLQAQLSAGFQIRFPVIDKPASPTYQKFREMFQSELAGITEPIILIGHSLGASTLLKYLSEEKTDITILGLFLVSAPHWKSNMKEFQLRENFQSSLTNIPSVFLYHSQDDEDVPIDNLSFYSKAFPSAVVHKLNGKEHTFSKGLPQLVTDIKSLQKNS